MRLPRLENAQVADKRILVQIDCKNSLNSSGKISNPLVPGLVMPTVGFLLQKGASVLLLTHASEPHSEKPLKLDTLAEYMSGSLKYPVEYVHNPLKTKTKEILEKGASRQSVSLTNLSVYSQEVQNKKEFVDQLASLGSIYVNEARSANKQNYTSITQLPKLLPAYAGLGLSREWDFLQAIQEKDNRKLGLVLAGVNLEKKFSLLQKLMNHLDVLLLGGGLAYSFLHSRAVPVGNSLREHRLEVQAFQLLEKAEQQRIDTGLPTDHLIAQQISSTARSKNSTRIPENWIAVDIGRKTLVQFEKKLAKLTDILWYGPLGVNEIKKFSHASNALAKSLAKSKARVCAIGNDTTALIHANQNHEHYYYLEPDSDFVIAVLTGQPLPGIAALQKD